MGLLRSPNIKFKIKYCAECNLEIINESDEIKCDICSKFFHLECSNDAQLSNETIWICSKCNPNDEICTNRDKFEIKTSNCAPKNQLSMNAIVNLDRVDFQCARDGLNNSYEIKLMKMELKIAEFERRLTRAEKNECKCIRKVESFVTHTEKVMLSQKQKPNDEIVPNPIEIVDKQSKTATEKKTTRIKSLTYEMASLNRKIDSCEAICDTNLTFCTEIQKQIDDTKCRIADLENNKQTISESQSQTIMSGAIIEIGNAIKRHNNTIKTHLKLSEAYNLDVMEKINNTMHEINKINDNNKHSNQNDNSGLS